MVCGFLTPDKPERPVHDELIYDHNRAHVGNAGG
jgi:hypothetical protein